jgi:hypothetical protein
MGLKQKESGTFFNLKIIEQTSPEIQQVGKNKKGEWEVVATGNNYEGIFVDAKIEEYTYKKDTLNKIVLEFHDEDGNKETLSANFNSLTLNIINTLSSVENLVGKKISFTVYTKKDDKGEDRPRIFIEINGQKGEWKYGPDIVGKIYEHQDKWIDMFNKHIKPQLGIAKPEEEESNDQEVFEKYNEEKDTPPAKSSVKAKADTKGGKKTTKKEPEPEPEEDEEEIDDDLPF